jgi:hypothetical protein
MNKEKFLIGAVSALALCVVSVGAGAQTADEGDYYKYIQADGNFSPSYPKIYYNGFDGNLKTDPIAAMKQFASKGSAAEHTRCGGSAANDTTGGAGSKTCASGGIRNAWDASGNYWIPMVNATGGASSEFFPIGTEQLLKVTASQMVKSGAGNSVRFNFTPGRNYDNNGNPLDLTLGATTGNTGDVYSGKAASVDMSNNTMAVAVTTAANSMPRCSTGQALGSCTGDESYISYKNSSGGYQTIKATLQAAFPDGSYDEVVPLSECAECRTPSNDAFCVEVLNEIAKYKCASASDRSADETNYIRFCDTSTKVTNLVAALNGPKGVAPNQTAGQALPTTIKCDTCLASTERLISQRLPNL